MKFTCEIDMDNDSFDDPTELEACLERVALQAFQGFTDGKVLDTNGNTVGEWEVQ